ncbi:hypothetical protein B0T14DRAFT_275601 [Immersiella caudata]|uniref:Uncharacterized protein n=1 Tax=Immersiella caudata TaxID=314043 RepID=A0AA40BTM7_9PEZI|nr:hypothetical protein B0T14DRAFT_275601 [Immersiella caudata]
MPSMSPTASEAPCRKGCKMPTTSLLYSIHFARRVHTTRAHTQSALVSIPQVFIHYVCVVLHVLLLPSNNNQKGNPVPRTPVPFPNSSGPAMNFNEPPTPSRRAKPSHTRRRNQPQRTKKKESNQTETPHIIIGAAGFPLPQTLTSDNTAPSRSRPVERQGGKEKQPMTLIGSRSISLYNKKQVKPNATPYPVPAEPRRVGVSLMSEKGFTHALQRLAENTRA